MNTATRAVIERLVDSLQVVNNFLKLAENNLGVESSGDYDAPLIAEARAALAGLEDERQWPDASHGYDSRDAMLLHNFREVLEEIAGSTNLTATPDQFAAHLQRTARNALIAARVKR